MSRLLMLENHTQSPGIQGTATTTDATLMLLKGFVGTGGTSLLPLPGCSSHIASSELSHIGSMMVVPSSCHLFRFTFPVLFMGRAFFNGGLLFSTFVLLLVGMISLWAFLLLVKTRLVIPGSFGDIGGTLYGPW